jgi:hypothetical protein
LVESLTNTAKSAKGCRPAAVEKRAALCYTLAVMRKGIWRLLLLLLCSIGWHAFAEAVGPAPMEKMATAVNQLRRQHGLPGYVSHPTLVRLAQAQAERMAALQSATHLGAGNSSAADRAAGAGYTDRATEIIYGGPGDHQKAIAWWLNSSLHKSLILSDRYFEFGVGRAEGANGHTYWAIVMGAGTPAVAGTPVVAGPAAEEAQPPATSAQPGEPADHEQTAPTTSAGATLTDSGHDSRRPPATRQQAPRPSSQAGPAKAGQPHPSPAAERPSREEVAPPAVHPLDPVSLSNAFATKELPVTDVRTGFAGGIILALMIATAVYVRRLRF